MLNVSYYATKKGWMTRILFEKEILKLRWEIKWVKSILLCTIGCLDATIIHSPRRNKRKLGCLEYPRNNKKLFCPRRFWTNYIKWERMVRRRWNILEQRGNNYKINDKCRQFVALDDGVQTDDQIVEEIRTKQDNDKS